MSAVGDSSAGVLKGTEREATEFREQARLSTVFLLPTYPLRIWELKALSVNEEKHDALLWNPILIPISNLGLFRHSCRFMLSRVG